MAWVLFFDGECAFCSGWVRRVMKSDIHQRIKFARLQGKLAAEKGFTSFADKDSGSMVLLRESDGAVFTSSDAAIELARVLGGWWRLFLPAVLIPKFLRNAVYRWVARHRGWFSKNGNFCALPDPEMEKRILE